MNGAAKVVSRISPEYADGRFEKTVVWRNLLKIRLLSNVLKETVGGFGVVGGGCVLNVALCWGKCEGKLAWIPGFGAR